MNEEVSMMPAEALSMDMLRSAHGRKDRFQLHMGIYAQVRHLCGSMSLVLLIGDCLQIKPPKHSSRGWMASSRKLEQVGSPVPHDRQRVLLSDRLPFPPEHERPPSGCRHNAHATANVAVS